MKVYQKTNISLMVSLLAFYCAQVKFIYQGQEWSEELAPRINWYDASLKCSEMGMRLPTVNEMDTIFKSQKTREWEWMYGVYWTSEENLKNNERASVYNFDFSKASETRKSDNYNARCIK